MGLRAKLHGEQGKALWNSHPKNYAPGIGSEILGPGG